MLDDDICTILERERKWEKAQRMQLERCDRESRAKWLLVVMAVVIVMVLALVWVKP
jgi:hypothetical protein